MDTLSKVVNQSSSAPKLIWSTKFAGVTLGTPTKITNFNWDTSVDGTDTLTGRGFTTDTILQSYLGPTAAFKLQQISGESIPDLATFNSNFTNTIATSTNLISTPGAGHLSIRNLLCSSTYPDQSPLMMTRSSPSAVNYDLSEIYVSFVCMFPVGMALSASGQYKTFFEIKGGGLKQSLVDAVTTGANITGSSCGATDGDAGSGRFRIIIGINGVFGNLNELMCRIDDDANNGSVTAERGYWDETGYHAGNGSRRDHYSNYTGISAPLGVPLRFHMHYKRPPTPLYADRWKGIFKVAMENLSTKTWTTIANVEKSMSYQLSSTFNEPWTRIFPTSYDSVNDQEYKVTDIQLWTKPPIDF